MLPNGKNATSPGLKVPFTDPAPYGAGRFG
jgi:hypothetical protein